MISSSEPKINADQCFVKSALWSSPYKDAVFKSTHQKDFKLGHCLDIDDMTSSSKFGEFT